MKLLIDAHIPLSLKAVILRHSFDCLHTPALLLKKQTPDSRIRELSINEKRKVITRDTDFFNSYILKKQLDKVIFCHNRKHET